jgi:hypothetical protein
MPNSIKLKNNLIARRKYLRNPTFAVHILLIMRHDFHFVPRSVMMAGKEALHLYLESQLKVWAPFLIEGRR